MKRYYYAGAPYHSGTNLPNNVTGECEHEHKTPKAAQRCIDELNASIERDSNGKGYCDRVVMVRKADGESRVYVPEVAL